MITWLVGAALVASGPAHATSAEDRALIGQLDREVIALRQRAEHLQEQLATCSTASPPNALYSEFVSVLQGQPVKVDRDARITRVTVPMDVLFASDGMQLREEAEPVLDLLSTGLKLHTDLIIVATGYVDAAGPPPALAKRYPTTWEWSAARAAIVVRELVEGYGVSPHRFTAAGRGDQDPVASNDTPEGRLQNRRIVFSIEPGPSSMAPSSSTSQGQP